MSVKSTTDLIVEITAQVERNTRRMEALVAKLEGRGELLGHERPSLTLVKEAEEERQGPR